jgi:hypothetical protein
MTMQPLPPDDLEQLSDFIDGRLSGIERTEFEKRLANEPTLRAELESLQATVKLLREMPRLKAPRNFTLDPAVYGKSKPTAKILRPNVWRLSSTLGFAASLILIMAGLLLGGLNPAREDASNSANVAILQKGIDQTQTASAIPTVDVTALSVGLTEMQNFASDVPATEAMDSVEESLPTDGSRAFAPTDPTGVTIFSMNTEEAVQASEVAPASDTARDDEGVSDGAVAQGSADGEGESAEEDISENKEPSPTATLDPMLMTGPAGGDAGADGTLGYGGESDMDTLDDTGGGSAGDLLPPSTNPSPEGLSETTIQIAGRSHWDIRSYLPNGDMAVTIMSEGADDNGFAAGNEAPTSSPENGQNVDTTPVEDDEISPLAKLLLILGGIGIVLSLGGVFFAWRR